MSSGSGRGSTGPLMLLLGLILGAAGGYVFATSMTKDKTARGPSTAQMEQLTGRAPGGAGGPPAGARPPGGPGGGGPSGPGPGMGGPPGGRPGGGSSGGGAAPSVPGPLAEIIVDVNAANEAKPFGFTQSQKEQLANSLRVLSHVPVVPDAQARADQIKGMLTPEQTKAVAAAKSKRKGEVTDAEYKKALNGILVAIGANR